MGNIAQRQKNKKDQLLAIPSTNMSLDCNNDSLIDDEDFNQHRRVSLQQNSESNSTEADVLSDYNSVWNAHHSAAAADFNITSDPRLLLETAGKPWNYRSVSMEALEAGRGEASFCQLSASCSDDESDAHEVAAAMSPEAEMKPWSAMHPTAIVRPDVGFLESVENLVEDYVEQMIDEVQDTTQRARKFSLAQKIRRQMALKSLDEQQSSVDDVEVQRRHAAAAVLEDDCLGLDVSSSKNMSGSTGSNSSSSSGVADLIGSFSGNRCETSHHVGGVAVAEAGDDDGPWFGYSHRQLTVLSACESCDETVTDDNSRSAINNSVTEQTATTAAEELVQKPGVNQLERHVRRDDDVTTPDTKINKDINVETGTELTSRGRLAGIVHWERVRSDDANNSVERNEETSQVHRETEEDQKEVVIEEEKDEKVEHKKLGENEACDLLDVSDDYCSVLSDEVSVSDDYGKTSELIVDLTDDTSTLELRKSRLTSASSLSRGSSSQGGIDGVGEQQHDVVDGMTASRDQQDEDVNEFMSAAETSFETKKQILIEKVIDRSNDKNSSSRGDVYSDSTSSRKSVNVNHEAPNRPQYFKVSTGTNHQVTGVDSVAEGDAQSDDKNGDLVTSRFSSTTTSTQTSTALYDLYLKSKMAAVKPTPSSRTIVNSGTQTLQATLPDVSMTSPSAADSCTSWQASNHGEWSADVTFGSCDESIAGHNVEEVDDYVIEQAAPRHQKPPSSLTTTTTTTRRVAVELRDDVDSVSVSAPKLHFYPGKSIDDDMMMWKMMISFEEERLEQLMKDNELALRRALEEADLPDCSICQTAHKTLNFNGSHRVTLNQHTTLVCQVLHHQVV